MSDLSHTIISGLTLLGVGGVIGGYITYLLDKKKEREFRVLEQKERRYKSCLLLYGRVLRAKKYKIPRKSAVGYR
ncbi:MAG TPA: hypothetical protein VN966_05925 [Candidatus Bathyarchaeia archaeon]|nr:hypothetical protein [Candidatus Bathyarchaeia archaeon]